MIRIAGNEGQGALIGLERGDGSVPDGPGVASRGKFQRCTFKENAVGVEAVGLPEVAVSDLSGDLVCLADQRKAALAMAPAPAG